MKTSDIIDNVRGITLDKIKPYRALDTEIMDWIDKGVSAIVRKRPDSRFDNDGELLEQTKTTQMTDTLCINDSFQTCLVDYVCFRYFMQESSDEGNTTKTKMHYNSYEEALGI